MFPFRRFLVAFISVMMRVYRAVPDGTPATAARLLTLVASCIISRDVAGGLLCAVCGVVVDSLIGIAACYSPALESGFAASFSPEFSSAFAPEPVGVKLVPKVFSMRLKMFSQLARP